jgi:hypothetical protein
MVDCVVGGVKAFFTYLWTSDVLPTPWLPSTTILASRLFAMACGWRCRGCAEASVGEHGRPGRTWR